MKTFLNKSQSELRRQSGLTLVEMMVATTLLVVIMLGLTAMFNQTSRAFRGGLKQVDVFEGGRAVMDMVARDVEQLTASKTIDNWSLFSGIQALTSLEQPLPGDSPTFTNRRTNVLHSVFLLNYSSQWTALGYRVLNPKDIDTFNTLSYGSLYRFSTNFFEFPTTETNFYFNLFSETPSNLTNGYITRVADGVVHFKLRFYDSAGTLIPAYDQAGYLTNANISVPAVFIEEVEPTTLPGERLIGFSDAALPAMVEVELGILEPQTLKQAESLSDTGPAPTPRAAYLQRQAGKVHIFRQQIPIRNAPR